MSEHTTSDPSTSDPSTVPVSSKVVVVTGASSGIGEATALRLAGEGHTVVAGARRQDRLEDLVRRAPDGPGRIEAAQLDVTDAEQTIQVVADARRRHGRVDVLVANAGVMPLSRLDSLHLAEWDRMIDVNVRGLLHSIAAVLPVFVEQARGHLVTIASVGAREVPPTSAVYSGTKFAQRAITEGLRVESPPEVRVTTISPGVVTSELAESITEPGAAEMMTTYRANAMPADAIARAVSYALGQPDDVDVNEIIVRPARQR